MFRLNHSDLIQRFPMFLVSDFKGEVFLGLSDVKAMLGLDWCLKSLIII
jgi:hypothetical protein